MISTTVRGAFSKIGCELSPMLAAGEAPPRPVLTAAFAELLDALAKASEGASRVRGITRDILVFAQGDPAPPSLVDVRAVVESSLQVAWHELRHRARVVRKLLEVPPVTANATPLAHVFLHPLLNAARATPEGSAERKEVARRVLVVDADPLVSEAIVRSLEGSELSVATDARRAVELIAGEDIDVVLCDVMLPGPSGIDFYVEMLRVAPDRLHRVVFMAGGATTTRARAFLAGITNPCLEKPLDLSQLRRLVDRAG